MLRKLLSRSAVFGVVTLASVLAQAHDGADGWVTLNQAHDLWSNTYEGDEIRIMLKSPDYYNPYGCTAADSYMVSMSIAAEARQRIYTTLLSAKLAGKPVRLFIDGCENGGKVPRVQHIAIE